MKTHPAIAPLVESGRSPSTPLVIPEAGFDMMPSMIADGLPSRRRRGDAWPPASGSV